MCIIFFGIKAYVYKDGVEEFLGYFWKWVTAIRIGRKVVDINDNSIVMWNVTWKYDSSLWFINCIY